MTPTGNIISRIAAAASGDHPAVWENGAVVTYGGLLARADALAHWLAEQTGFPGSHARIGLDAPGGVDYIALALGVLAAGACLVPVAGELTAAEREDLARQTHLHGMLSWKNGAPVYTPLDPAPFAHEEEFRALFPAFIRFSSGTTGASKGVIISHAALSDRVTAANAGLRIGPDDKILWLLPMAHHFAVSIILYLCHGATTVLCADHLAAGVLAAAETASATVVYASPFHHALLAADASGKPWPSLRLAVSTAAALPLETAEKFLARFGVPLTQGLGVIEVGLPLLNLRAARDRPTALGHALPAFETRSDAAGVLHLRGPGMFDAYFSPWQPRADACPGGWFSTGDVVSQDETGLITLRGRAKSAINVNGMKVFPEEVEGVLDSHPSVARSLVSAVPHAIFGSLLEARFIPADPAHPPDRKTLALWCRERLSPYKIPTRFLAASSLPVTASGKLRRG